MITTTTTTTPTFVSFLRIAYIRCLIFHYISILTPLPKKKGREICLDHRDMIGRYAMPWYFTQHYLHPLIDTRSMINQYIIHPNSTIQTLEYLLKWSRGYTVPYCLFEKVAGRIPMGGGDDSLQLFKYLETIMYPLTYFGSDSRFGSESISTASSRGDLPMVKYLYNKGISLSYGTMNNASKYGHLEIVEFLHHITLREHTNPSICQEKAMDEAASNGHLEVVKFLHYNRTEGCTDDAIDMASRNGHLEVVKFLHYNRTEGCTNNAMDFACRYGHMEVVEFLHSVGKSCSRYAMEGAAYYGHFEIVKFLHSHEKPCGFAMFIASVRGYFEIFKYLYYNGGGNPQHLMYFLVNIIRYGYRLSEKIDNEQLESPRKLVTVLSFLKECGVVLPTWSYDQSFTWNSIVYIQCDATSYNEIRSSNIETYQSSHKYRELYKEEEEDDDIMVEEYYSPVQDYDHDELVEQLFTGGIE